MVIKRSGGRRRSGRRYRPRDARACRGRPRIPADRQARYRLARPWRLPHRRPRRSSSDYIADFPAGATLMLQRFVPYAAEAAVLYARLPGEASGRILSLTLRYFPHVVGNGRMSVRELIAADARAQWKSRPASRRRPRPIAASMPLDLDRVPAQRRSGAHRVDRQSAGRRALSRRPPPHHGGVARRVSTRSPAA